MGGIVSTGEDNDDLVDNLKSEGYIETSIVEDVFRAVDRADYYLDDHKDTAYRDTAWKHGHLHLSAPCIYSKVMESLQLQPSMSFLNVGSGTGYLNSMAGLILGHYGINHGIEIHSDVIDYANDRLAEFCSKCHGFDSFEFCEPTFVLGNCFLMEPGMRLYDRVYCGAACPQEHQNFMKNLIKIGGVLVMPLNDQLLQIKRISESEWESKSVLPVSFATLITPPDDVKMEHIQLPLINVTSLQDACRLVIRRTLRYIIKNEHPELKKRSRKKPKIKNRAKRSSKNRISVYPMSVGMVMVSHMDQDFDEDDEADRCGENKENVESAEIVLPNNIEDIDIDDEREFTDIIDISRENNGSSVRRNQMETDSEISDEEIEDEDENGTLCKSRDIMQPPRKSRRSCSTSADTETSGLGTLSDHSDDQESSSMDHSPTGYKFADNFTDDSVSGNKASAETKPMDCDRPTPATSGASRSLDSGRHIMNLMSSLSRRYIRRKKQRTASENDKPTENEVVTETPESSAMVESEPVPIIDKFKEYMIEKVSLLPVPVMLRSFLMFERV